MAVSELEERADYVRSGLLGWPGIFIGICILGLALFTAIPGTIEGKSLAVLHGLCAQQPTHSYYFGEARLPFDARMTGIYSGFALTATYLAIRGRWRVAGVPQARVIATLALFVLPLAIDGTNSFLKDVNLPYLYEPHNVIRTITGLMLGLTLATFTWMLVGQTAFRPGDRSHEMIWDGLREIAVLLASLVALVPVVGLSGIPVRIPLTYLLMASAAALVAGLLLPFILLLTGREQRAETTTDLAQPATLALLAALLFIAAMSGGRFFLELALGVSSQVPA